MFEFRSGRTLSVGILILANALTACGGGREKSVTFVVTTGALPSDAIVYITGNTPQLGNWDPAARPLARQPDGTWSATFTFPAGALVEYKFTRGSWDDEALGEDGRVPPNSRLEVTQDQTVRATINFWKDLHWEPDSDGVTGNLKRHPKMESPGLLPRDVWVWLPPGYEGDIQDRYPVLYMHDGQQVFNPATSTHGVDWGADETATRLIEEGKIRELIIVAVNNTGDRVAEYSDTPKGLAYRRFIVETLKPFIDRTYRTLPSRADTAVMGSSMGGLVSFLLVWRHSDTFSAAGCLSPAFFPDVVESVDRGSRPQDIKIYLDNGGVGLEERLQPGFEAMLGALRRRGFQDGDDLLWFQDAEAEHTEAAWAARLWRPLEFFFGVRDR